MHACVGTRSTGFSARYGRTVYAAFIEGDLRAVFYLEGDTVVSVDIGSHSLYRS